MTYLKLRMICRKKSRMDNYGVCNKSLLGLRSNHTLCVVSSQALFYDFIYIYVLFKDIICIER